MSSLPNVESPQICPPERRRPRLRPAAVAVAVALGLTFAAGGCGDDGGTATEASTTVASTSPTATTSTSGGSASTSASAPTTSTPPTTSTSQAGEQRVEVTYANGEVAGGVKRVKLTAGKPVSLAITIDVADEVHVHGYDIEGDLAAGQTTVIAFTADIPGVFEVELHHAGKKLVELEVR